ncbi:hypothetical protein EV702DRAFT_1246628 [Suillus placidus]|uniref:DUF1899 domain-containing protein n=1 Tax=Suillus placidus TaxID=48579 RepID=A0A9P6ZN74_9AGAM|nr:hypothetical protein EV702DRAFT_1246628 [Suillus placidus]
MTDRIEVSSGSVSSGDSNSNDGTESYAPSRNMFQNADKEGHAWDITANLLENLLPVPNAVHTRGSAQLEDTRPPLQGYDIPDSSSVRRHPNNEETPQLQQLSRHNSISHHGRSLVGFATVKDKGALYVAPRPRQAWPQHAQTKSSTSTPPDATTNAPTVQSRPTIIDKHTRSPVAWDTNLVSASGRYISVNFGGGPFAILPLPSTFAAIPNFPYKLPEVIPLARSHTAPVLDTDWSPHNASLLPWVVEPSAFEDWGQDHWVPEDFDPVARIDPSPRKIGQVLFHPTTSNILISAFGEYTVKLWDFSDTDRTRSVLTGHKDTIQCLAFNPAGTPMTMTCRDSVYLI